MSENKPHFSGKSWVLGAVFIIVLGLGAGSIFLIMRPNLNVIITIKAWAIPTASSLIFTVSLLTVIFIQRKARRKREDSARQMAQAEREAHRRFLSRLDHELKNPLTAICTGIAAHRQICPASEDGKYDANLDVVSSQGARLAGLVADLRKLSDLETQSIEREKVSIEMVVSDVVADVHALAATHGKLPPTITVTMPSVPWRIPQIIGDLDLLYLAVYNVVSNAVKFSTLQDHLDSTIEVRGFEEENWVVLDIADSGLGIREDEIDSVFDELVRGIDSREVPGSGLGLPLVKIIIERHGGTVSLTSRFGQGTRVRMRLPMA
jgi:Signal transduction histidine kinase